MNAYFSYLNAQTNKTRAAFAAYSNIKWLNAYGADDYEQIRRQLLQHFSHSTLFNATKPYYKQLSTGCRLCGAGKWSCLFVTGKCNAKCFYCPTDQSSDEPPSTQGLTFSTPQSYAEYVQHFGFKGVSFSGGEPLLFADRVVAYLLAVRQICAPDIYTWLYTNGILATDQIITRLQEAGLDEIRFDIGATGYKLDKIKLAAGKIPNITVEIPAVPEEKELLMRLLPQMIEAGVTNLNLHQLRLTHYNAPKLLKRNYTYIAAERPLVLESELAALEIMAYAARENLDIGINYCSFFFKTRFQGSGFRSLINTACGAAPGQITQQGYIRQQSEGNLCYLNYKIGDSATTDPATTQLDLKYKSYYLTLKKQFCTPGTTAQIDRLNGEIPSSAELFRIWQHEKIENGLREY